MMMMMMMRGGLKRKIQIEKRESKSQRAFTCSKRRKGVFKKAAEVSVACGVQIAVFVTSPSLNSDAIYSFSSSHSSSAYEIAQCFLNNQIPSKPKPNPNPNPNSNFWWENPDLELYEDSVQFKNLMDRLKKTKEDAIAAFMKKQQTQFLPISQKPQNPSFFG